MARALRIQYPGAFYHVTCRGNARMDIFHTDGDRAKFLSFLARSLETYQVILISYILMDNHFHMLIQTIRANLADFMRHLNVSYTGWFNFRHKRVGHLFQGRYKAYLVDADNYLLEVSRYVHLNSVRSDRLQRCDLKERWEFACQYPWSSLPGYVHRNKQQQLISYSIVLEMVGGRRLYKNYIMDGIRHDVRNPFENARKGFILGDGDFVSRLKHKYLGDGSLREQPSYRKLIQNIIEPEVIIEYVAQRYNIEKRLLKQQRKRGLGDIRGITAELLYRFSGITLAEIGKFLGGIDYSGVYQMRRRLRDILLNDQKFRQQFEKIGDDLKRYVQSRDLTPEGGGYA